jgi:hypothetical protein
LMVVSGFEGASEDGLDYGGVSRWARDKISERVTAKFFVMRSENGSSFYFTRSLTLAIVYYWEIWRSSCTALQPYLF